MLALTNRLVRRLIGTRTLNNINHESLFTSDTPWVLKSESVRFVSFTPKLNNNEDPCKAKDVYKISPLCPPRGYEFKKEPESLKCQAKKPCPPVTKGEAKPKPPPPPPPPKVEEKKDCPKKKEVVKNECKDNSKKEVKEPPKKEPTDRCITEEKRCAKKELKDCKKKEPPPTCGKTPDKCSIELPKSVKPSPQEKRAKVRPGMKLECPPRTKDEMDKKCQKKCCKEQPEVETCCSPRPWPFNLFDKPCNKPPKKKCPVRSKEEGKKKYSTSSQDSEFKEFHTSSKKEMRPICPPCPSPLCSGGIGLPKDTEKLMVKLRAVARANRRRLPPQSCVVEPEPTPCLAPSEGWGKSHDFILMRSPECLMKLPKKVIAVPRLVTRKLRKRQ